MNYAYATAPGAIKVAMKLDSWDLVMQAGFTVKLVLLLLLVFSIVSWGIIFTKKMQLTELSIVNSKFLDYFWKAGSLDKIFEELGRFKTSSLASVFAAGYGEIQKLAESQTTKGDGLIGGQIDNVARAMRKASDNEIAKIESRTAFLATVGSTAPFIGLFGTVWGIMSAFQNIGATGSASLAVVAPGISEALITTAVGLAAAIPAVMGYNYFVGKFKKQDLEISNFSADFLNIVKRNFFKE